MSLFIKKVSLKKLSKMVEETNLETTTSAFKKALAQGVSDPDSIWLTFYRMTNPARPRVYGKLPNHRSRLS